MAMRLDWEIKSCIGRAVFIQSSESWRVIASWSFIDGASASGVGPGPKISSLKAAEPSSKYRSRPCWSFAVGRAVSFADVGAPW